MDVALVTGAGALVVDGSAVSQPVNDGGGSLTVDGPLTDAQLRASPVPVSDGGGSLTVDTPQLPAVLVGGRLDENVGAWMGSTAPTVGQKAMASSLPVVIASDQSAVTANPTQPSVGALTITSVSTSNVQVAAANANRKGCVISNDGSTVVYIALGFTATTGAWTFRIPANSSEPLQFPCYTGVINAIRASGTSNVLVTELT
jgi:hypothetical protein